MFDKLRYARDDPAAAVTRDGEAALVPLAKRSLRVTRARFSASSGGAIPHGLTLGRGGGAAPLYTVECPVLPPRKRAPVPRRTARGFEKPLYDDYLAIFFRAVEKLAQNTR